LLGSLSFLGCGGATSTADLAAASDAASDSAASSDEPAGMTQEAATVPARNPECPASIPPAGGPCKPILTCDYGGGEHQVCRTRVDCASSDGTNFKWFVSSPAAGCGTSSASCPASFTALADGSPCPGLEMNSFCYYPEGRCGCVRCDSDAGISSMWACRKWGPTEDGCPPDPPLSGDACSTPNQQCSYGGFCRFAVGPTMMCDDGYWKQGGQTGSCIIPSCGAP
jgi:hypothetical protein